MNRKGFTLIEILGTVTILGIISVIAVMGYQKYMNNARQKAYDNMANSAMIATEEAIEKDLLYVYDTVLIEENIQHRQIISGDNKISDKNNVSDKDKVIGNDTMNDSINTSDISELNVIDKANYEDILRSDGYPYIYYIYKPTSSKITFEYLVENGFMSMPKDPANNSRGCGGFVRAGVVKSSFVGGLDRYIYEVYLCCSNYKKAYFYSIAAKKDENDNIVDTKDIIRKFDLEGTHHCNYNSM